jgi:PleD family two-component response regulator
MPRVLIVDDDPLMAEHLQVLVSAAGFEVRTVISGAAALAAMRKKFASIVITDLHMPDMDGLTLCPTLRDEQFGGIAALTIAPSVDALLESADHCLYSSKGAGRNRVTLATVPHSTSTGQKRPLPAATFPALDPPLADPSLVDRGRRAAVWSAACARYSPLP